MIEPVSQPAHVKLDCPLYPSLAASDLITSHESFQLTPRCLTIEEILELLA